MVGAGRTAARPGGAPDRRPVSRRRGSGLPDGYLGERTIWVHRKRAISFSVESFVTLASHTWVCRPRCAGSQRHETESPTRADERKLDFSSIVVKEAPSGMLLPQPMAAQASARATTAGAKRNPVPAMRLSVTSMCPTTRSLAEWSKMQPSLPGTSGSKNSVARRALTTGSSRSGGGLMRSTLERSAPSCCCSPPL